MDIGTGITQMLAAADVTAAELSRRCGITPGTISSYQSGRTTPSLHALALIAAALGVRVSELIARAEAATGAAGDSATQALTAQDAGPHAYRLEDSTGQALSTLSALSERQRRALLNFLQAMEERA